MKKINIAIFIVLAASVLTLFIISVFFHFYTYNTDGGVVQNWSVNESVIFLGTARVISLISGCLILLCLILFLINQDKSARKQNVSGVLFTALGAFTIIGSLNFFYPCTDVVKPSNMPMHCYWTMKVLLSLAGAIGVSGVLMLLFSKSKDFVNGLNAAVFIFSFLYVFAPTRLTDGFCSMIMACTERYRPFAFLMGCLILVLSAVNGFLLFKNSKRQS